MHAFTKFECDKSSQHFLCLISKASVLCSLDSDVFANTTGQGLQPRLQNHQPMSGMVLSSGLYLGRTCFVRTDLIACGVLGFRTKETLHHDTRYFNSNFNWGNYVPESKRRQVHKGLAILYNNTLIFKQI